MEETTKGSAEERSSYFAVLLGPVLFDPDLPDFTKLLYAVITSLTDQTGFCWASNAYFSRKFSKAPRTIQRSLKELQDGGFIRIIDGDGGPGRRKIYAGFGPIPGDHDKNVTVTVTKMSPDHDKNVTQNKKENKKENDPPKAPQGAGEPKSTPKWKPERFEAFWRYYPAIPDGNGHGRRPAKDRAARAWDKLHADDSEIDLMAAALQRQKASRQWRDGVGIPYASTWLNSRAWLDEVEDLDDAAQDGQRELEAWIGKDGELVWM